MNITEWIAANLPPDEEMERVTRQLISRHEQWDSMHAFVLYQLVDNKVSPALIVGIPPTLDPGFYPHMLAEFIAKFMAPRMERDEPPIVGATLFIEAFGLEFREGPPTPHEQSMIAQRRLHELPGATEKALAITADIAGRTWCVMKERQSESIHFHGPEHLEDEPLGGMFTDILVRSATVLPHLYCEVSQ